MSQLRFELLLLLDQMKPAQCLGITQAMFDGVEALPLPFWGSPPIVSKVAPWRLIKVNLREP